jgi:ATP-dependent RNA/DNA helicase IGHMBP2
LEHLSELYTLKELLALEKKADLEHFKTIIQNKPLDQRRAEGFTWYPIVVTQTGYTYGERAFVVVERGGSPDAPHQFRSGNVVSLFTQQTDVYKPEKTGVIQYISKNKMQITLNSKDLPDWLSGGSLGVDLLFDERTYLEMERALEQVINAKGSRLAELRDVFLGKKEIEKVYLKDFYAENSIVSVENKPVSFRKLNAAQQQAVETIAHMRDVVALHGPPGTGKTTTLVAAVRLISETENTILVTAPSNTAADLLTERLAAEGLRVVRLGNISRVDEDLVQHTLDAQISAHPESKNIKKIKIKAAELRRKARTYKRRFDGDARNQRDVLKKEAAEMSAWANELEGRLIDEILDTAQVITCTLVGANSNILEKRKFRTVVIDEAAQALEPATWIPILRASRVVLAGDPFQLPPTVKSIEAKRQGFSRTLIEKLIERQPNVQLLNVQYRMHQTIMGFSNAFFYNDQLVADASVAERILNRFQDENPLVFIDTAGCGFEEKQHPENLSRYNPEEYYALREHLYQYLESFEYEKPYIGIISPYREQVVFMEKEIEEDPILRPYFLTKMLEVSTIDGFQGQEGDVIYVSLVRSNEKNEIGFLSDYRRMNVALTRARMKLIVIGDSATIGSDKFYKHFLDYADAQGSYRSAWEFMKP